MANFPVYHRDDDWKIWFETYHDGEKIGAGVWLQSYKHKSSAVRRAKKQFNRQLIDYSNGRVTTYKWTVSQTNPWSTESSRN